MAKPADKPNPTIHRCHCRVLYGDTDSGGVVYYANYLRYFECGRTEFMRALTSSYKDLEEQGYILPVVECYSRYKASASYDDLLLIETSVSAIKAVSCRFDYRILREPDQKLLALGHTVHAAVNRQGKLVKLPRELLERLQAVGGNQD